MKTIPMRPAILRSTPLAPAFLLLAAVLFSAPAARAAAPVNVDRAKLALQGYDPVAYFEAGKAVKGKAGHAVTWMGATWRFASAKNKEAFQADPRRYAPQYGGYCAWAVSQGYTADADPHAWKIVNGKLYLNYDKSIQKKWEKDIPGLIARADRNWPGILKKK